jgi:agmatinase
MTAIIAPVPLSRPTFLDVPRCDDLAGLEAGLAVVGIPYTTPPDLAHSRSPSSSAPDAIREQSLRLAGSLGHYDFDFGGELLAGRAVKMVDCGEVAMLPGRYAENGEAAMAVVRAILERGAFPTVLGGDRAATISALRAYDGRGPLCVVQLGAELAWRDEVNGVRDSLHSAMRRAAELPGVSAMVQIGLRGPGACGRAEVDDARAFGSVLVRAEELHERGVEAALRRVPPAARYYLSLDAGALDPAIAPGVETPAFGGLSYFEATGLLKGLAAKGRLVGMDLVGVVPSADSMGLTSLLAARLILNLVGALAQTGQLGARRAGFEPVGAAKEAAR